MPHGPRNASSLPAACSNLLASNRSPRWGRGKGSAGKLDAIAGHARDRRLALEVAARSLAERSRAAVRDAALHRPAGDRDDPEQRARDGAEAHAAADDAEHFGNPLLVELEAVGVGDAHEHSYLVHGQDREVGPGDEHGHSDDAVLPREVGDHPVDHGLAEHRKPGGERRSALAEVPRDRAGDLVHRKAGAGRDADDVLRERVRRVGLRVRLRACQHGHDRHVRPLCALEHLEVAVADRACEHVHEYGCLGDRGLVAHRARDTAARELAPQHAGQLACARDGEWLVLLRRGPELADEPQHLRRREGKLRRHYPRRNRPRTWIACKSPIIAMLAMSDEPPTLTKGSVIPVTGARPIVIPTLTKIWKTNAKTTPAATIAENPSRATVTIFSPRQTTSR